jgi:hypothetical protein
MNAAAAAAQYRTTLDAAEAAEAVADAPLLFLIAPLLVWL